MFDHDADNRRSNANGSRIAPHYADALARGLGWLGVGFGAVELFGAHGMARWLGMEKHESMIRASGAREIATGIGILASRDKAPWMWTRVAGDALDLARLGKGAAGNSTEKDRIGLAMIAVAGVTVLDVICAQSLENGRRSHRTGGDGDHSRWSRPPRHMRALEEPREMRKRDTPRPYNQARVSTSRPLI